MERAFGPVYAKSLASDLVIGALGSQTAQQALSHGVPPRQVWDALCQVMEVPEATRWAYMEPAKRRPTH